ncbi:MAG: shikimate dehydrogenase, partial [Trueperaceae bacterium]|nr:shikimate dehydrogenase [Trueperaceae bacterium]
AEVGVHNRTSARAAALVAAWRHEGSITEVVPEQLVATSRAARLVVNTTSVGMLGGPAGSPLPAGALPVVGLVVDLVYRPRVTPLLAAASSAGLRVQDGLAMLVHQGGLAFEAWTGSGAPLDDMRRALGEALAP